MTIDRDFVSQHFGRIWPVHNRAFGEMLVTCRRLLDGDMDQILILASIGDRMLTRERVGDIAYRDLLAKRPGSGAARPINTQSIADSTGIPRETVRRKLGLLMARGWVEKAEDGTLTTTGKAAVELAEATEAAFDYIVALGNVLLGLEAERSGPGRVTGPSGGSAA